MREISKNDTRWRKILNTPFVKGDIVRVKNNTLFADLKRRPIVVFLVEKGRVFKVVEVNSQGVIIEDEKYGRLLAQPKELELIGHEDSREGMEKNP